MDIVVDNKAHTSSVEQEKLAEISRECHKMFLTD